MFSLTLSPQERDMWNTITLEQKQVIASLLTKFLEVDELPFEEILDESDAVIGHYLNPDEFMIWDAFTHEQLHLLVTLFNRFVEQNDEKIDSMWIGNNEHNEDWSAMGFQFDEVAYQCLVRHMDGTIYFKFLNNNN